ETLRNRDELAENALLRDRHANFIVASCCGDAAPAIVAPKPTAAPGGELMNRRDFLVRGSALLASGVARAPLGRRAAWAQAAPAVVPSDRARPTLPYGVQSGDMMADRAIVWSRADRPARMLVEWATNDAFRDARRVVGPAALADSDFTARVDLVGLQSGADEVYPVSVVDLAYPLPTIAPG